MAVREAEKALETVWIPVPAHVVDQLERLLGRPIMLSERGTTLVTTAELDIIFAIFVYAADEVEIARAEAEAARTAARDEETARQLARSQTAAKMFAASPDLALLRLADDDWRNRLYTALHPDSEYYAERELALPAAELLLLLRHQLAHDVGYLLDAAELVVADR